MEFINLSSTASTLLITLYSRAALSKKGIILQDKKAEEIIDITGYDKKKLKVSFKLQTLLTLRAYIMDEYVKEFIERHNGKCNVIQLGCGLDSRCARIDDSRVCWYDLDLYGTMLMRKKYYKSKENYKMIIANVCNLEWINEIEDKKLPTIFIGEGLFMYLTENENKLVLNALCKEFPGSEIIMDVFNKASVKFSRFAPSLRRVNANMNFGFDNYKKIEEISPFKHVSTRYYYDEKDKINELPLFLRTRFKLRKALNLFCKVQRIEIYHN